MVGRRFLTEGLRVGTLLTVLGAALSPSDVAAQLPIAGSDPDVPALPLENDGQRAFDPRLLTANEMMSLSTKYSYDIENSVAKVEAVRKNARLERDGIKMACLDHLLPEMRMIRDTLADRFRSIAHRADEFLARADFLVISPGWRRVRELRSEAEECVGEALDSSSVSSNANEIPGGPNSEAVTDPPVRPVVVDRPNEASIYR
ncbi:MAG TPA: hypothetical protein VGL59_06310 [Polyangia bacterium]|jgi:hypothetical protein